MFDQYFVFERSVSRERSDRRGVVVMDAVDLVALAPLEVAWPHIRGSFPRALPARS